MMLFLQHCQCLVRRGLSSVQNVLLPFSQFMEVLELVSKGPAGYDTLFKTFNDTGYSDYVVVYLRLVASGQLQREAEFYQHFIEGDRTVADFCSQVRSFFARFYLIGKIQGYVTDIFCYLFYFYFKLVTYIK